MQTTFAKLSDVVFSFGMTITVAAASIMSLFGYDPESAGITLMLGFAMSTGMASIAAVKEYLQELRAEHNDHVSGYISGSIDDIVAAAKAAAESVKSKNFRSYTVSGRTYVDDFDAIKHKMREEQASRAAAQAAIAERYENSYAQAA